MVRLSTAYVAQLSLDIDFELGPLPNTLDYIMACLHDAAGNLVALTGQQRLTINGRDQRSELITNHCDYECLAHL